MLAMQCAACGQSISVDEKLGSGQPCPACGRSVGRLPVKEPVESTALSDLLDGGRPVAFGAYSKAAEEAWEDPMDTQARQAHQEQINATWDDPMEPQVEEQVARIVANERLVDSAVVNLVPPEVQARFKARQREIRKKLMGIAVVAALILLALVAFILY